MQQPWERWIFVGFPAGVLLLSFVVVCVALGTIWPWTEVVHEDGSRSLLGTIFYFEHALRELPLDLLLAAAVASSAAHFHPAARKPAAPERKTAASNAFSEPGPEPLQLGDVLVDP